MNEAQTRAHIQRHADAVLNGDEQIIVGDLSDEMRIRLPDLAKHVPQPLTAVDVTDVKFGDDHTTAVIKYTGTERSVSFLSHWKDTGGPHPVVIHAELADGES